MNIGAIISFTVPWVLCLMPLAFLLNTTVTEPYMDEIFHIPQAQTYCDYRFSEWNPKITTLPGLYLLSFVMNQVLALLAFILLSPFNSFLAQSILATYPPFQQLLDSSLSPYLSSRHVFCSAGFLRLTNVLLASGCAFVIHLLTFQLQTHVSSHRRALKTMELCTFPLHFFFSFMYYTDTGSTFFVLLMYLLSLRGDITSSALSGAVAVLFRQTNIVWVFFVFVTAVLQDFQDLHYLKEKEDLGRFRVAAYPLYLTELPNVIGNFALYVSASLQRILKRYFFYFLVFLGFVLFVISNQGIVVGDHDSHQSHIHIPQLYYFSMFTAGFMFFSTLRPAAVREVWSRAWALTDSLTALLLITQLATIMAWTVSKFTIEHPFLLADNRHYTFYLWKRVFRAYPFARYFFIPFYIAAFTVINYHFGRVRSLMWQLVFWFCVICVLVPSPLLEFRYFIIPFILIQLHEYQASKYTLIANTVCNLIVNSLTFIIFLYYPFIWNDKSIARFMW